MKVEIGAIEQRDGRSALTFRIEDGDYSAYGRLDLTALHYLTTNARQTKSGRAKRGPVSITRARRSVGRSASRGAGGEEGECRHAKSPMITN